MFTTGNLEHLKVHVEAHLYDAVRVANSVENEKINSRVSRMKIKVLAMLSRILNLN
jgi:hypothetical protein